MRSIDADDVKRQVDCRDLADHLGLKIAKRSVREWTAHCFNPRAHRHGDRNPSLSIGETGFTCFASSCGVTGSCIDLVMNLRGVDFKGAMDYLVSYAGLDPSVPPAPRSEPRRAPRKDPAREKIPAARLPVMREIWGPLEQLPLTPEAEGWLKSRGIASETAHGLGCRDWRPALPAIKSAIDRFEMEQLQLAGLYTRNEEPKLWWPLERALAGNRKMDGLVVPVFDREHPFPVAHRWRFYSPPVSRDGRTFKTAEQPGGGVPSLLGLRTTSPAFPAVGAAPLLLLAEGEPDWMSAHDALRGRAAVLGICAMARGWQKEWDSLLVGAERVVVMCHDDGGGGERMFDGVLTAFIKRYGKPAAERGCVRFLVDGKCDLNDRHRLGDLAPLLETTLSWIEKKGSEHG